MTVLEWGESILKSHLSIQEGKAPVGWVEEKESGQLGQCLASFLECDDRDPKNQQWYQLSEDSQETSCKSCLNLDPCWCILTNSFTI